MTVEYELEWHGPVVDHIIEQAALRGLRRGGEHILTESRKIVPIDEGTLERSGTVHVDRESLVAVISYDTPYAVRQHEELDYRHAPGRQAKYLEGPLLAERRIAMGIIAAEIRRATS